MKQFLLITALTLAASALALSQTPGTNTKIEGNTRDKEAIKTAMADVGAETEKIKAIIKKYAKSVTDADTRLASEIWSQTRDVSFIHPRGHEHGWEEIKGNVYEKMMRDTFSERKLNTSDISIHIYKDAAWAEFYWIFVAKFRSNGSPVRTEGRETQVYHKTDRGWRLVHVHYSGTPVKPKAEGF